MCMIELNPAQYAMLQEMATNAGGQIVLRPKDTDPEPRRIVFTKLNENIDKLLEYGFIELPANQPPPPPGFPYEFRIVNITELGLLMMGKGNSVRAIH